MIDSVEEGQISDAELSCFSDESAEQVANMFENIEGEELMKLRKQAQQMRIVADDGEVSGSRIR